MNHYTEIHPDGTRAYQFVADTAYVRESGTKGEHKAAEYILIRNMLRFPIKCEERRLVRKRQAGRDRRKAGRAVPVSTLL